MKCALRSISASRPPSRRPTTRNRNCALRPPAWGTDVVEVHRRALCDEKMIRGKSADERRAVRQEKSKPLVLALKTWLEQQLARVSTKSVIAEVSATA